MIRYTDVLHRRTLGALLLILFFAAPQLIAQSYYGSLRGQVTDAQGASVAGAIATLTNEATHIVRKAASNSAGEYVFASLDPGMYTLSISAQGFKKLDRKGITVSTQQTLTLDAKLQVGAATQSIEVTSADPLIDTSNASNGQVFDAQKLQDLPNLGRNPFLFSKLDNNVAPVGDPRFNRFQDQSGSSQISIAGGPINGNNYEIDGVPITDFFNRAVIIPSLDAVQEVKVQSTTYDAEMGRTGGGVFNTLLKSGTNTLHGNLYGETRQTGWAANTWFNDHKGIPKGNSTQYQYEGSIGGPVVIPHLYNGKGKTFFWLTEEGYRQRSPLTGSYYIPTAAERAGDFSADGTVNPDGTCASGLCIYDPATTTTDSQGHVLRTAFAGNVIPGNRINAVGSAILAAIPSCSSVSGAICSTTPFGVNNMTNTDLLGDRADEFIGKVDHQFAPWWLANASYMHYGSKEPGGNPVGSFAGTGGTSYLLYRKVDAFQENNTFSINPTTVATVAFGFNRFPNNTLDLSNGYNQSALGFPSSYVGALQKSSFPAIGMQSAASIGTNDSGPGVFYSRNFVVGISKSLGKHTLKAGYVFRSISVDFTNISYGNGQYSFDSTFTSADATASTKSGADVADLLLGMPSGGQLQTTTHIALNTHYNAGYIQDDIRVTPKLTVNAGLRYEWEPGIRERNNHYAVGFDRTVVNPISAASGTNTLGGIMFAGKNGYSTTCCNNSKTKFA
ncbi:MAG: carboxypeptidase-like regulatory domain-containing protein, partial [Acidobacteriaceae bacterium]